jgi:hypothetical protein
MHRWAKSRFRAYKSKVFCGSIPAVAPPPATAGQLQFNRIHKFPAWKLTPEASERIFRRLYSSLSGRCFLKEATHHEIFPLGSLGSARNSTHASKHSRRIVG